MIHNVSIILLLLISSNSFGQTTSRQKRTDPNGKPLGARVLFWDDFSNDVGWKSKPAGWTDQNVPSKWTSYSAITVEQEIVAGAGRNGGAALRLKYAYPHGYTETGRLTCEFNESSTVHIRLFMKLSEGFMFGKANEGGGFIWKQWRLHQSPWTRGKTPPFGTNNEVNSGYIVNTMRGGGGTDPVRYGHHASWRSDNGNSSNGAQVIYQHRTRPYQIPWGTYKIDASVTDTDWIQCDVYYELGDMNQDNGKIYQWFNGQLQPQFGSVDAFYGARKPLGSKDGLVTNARSHYGRPTGFNSFTLFDNYINLTLGWTKQHYVYVDSVTIFDGLPSDLTLPSR